MIDFALWSISNGEIYIFSYTIDSATRDIDIIDISNISVEIQNILFFCGISEDFYRSNHAWECSIGGKRNPTECLTPCESCEGTIGSTEGDSSPALRGIMIESYPASILSPCES